jgi:putative PEP-CTERM system histidine kinase
LGSTALSASDTETIGKLEKEVAFLMISIRDHDFPVDLDRSEWSRSQGYDSVGMESPASHPIRYGVPLAVGQDFLGIITLDEPLTGEPLSVEDLELLRTIGDQTAGAILNHRLFERLAKAKEMEAFQTLSAFFVHDLKNLASTLSLTLQNLPVHYDNPEFREDTLRLISRSVDRIKDMCGQLSQLDGKLELRLREADLNELVATTLDTLKGTLQATLNRDLRPIPKFPMDSEQMQKVLTNLLLNAGEASPEGGDIRVTTSKEGNMVVLEVSDEGSGMSREFMERSLFHPFKTTKKRGLGIGLYHSKMIVEAHRGRIEVLSEEGRGSTFRVVLPWM